MNAQFFARYSFDYEYYFPRRYIMKNSMNLKSLVCWPQVHNKNLFSVPLVFTHFSIGRTLYMLRYVSQHVEQPELEDNRLQLILGDDFDGVSPHVEQPELENNRLQLILGDDFDGVSPHVEKAELENNRLQLTLGDDFDVIWLGDVPTNQIYAFPFLII